MKIYKYECNKNNVFSHFSVYGKVFFVTTIMRKNIAFFFFDIKFKEKPQNQQC